MRKIYIAGCGGMLGKAFYKVFSEDYNLRCTDKDVNEPWLSLLDFRDYNNYAQDVTSFNPDFLFHLGAHTDLEYCEKNVDDAFLTNATSVEYAVKIANKLNIPILYISTAGIFDGISSPYDDDAIPNPISVYGKSKYEAEKYIMQNSREYLICRAGWMMGGGPLKDKKFINKIILQIKQGAKELNIVNDKDGTPTYTYDFANNVKVLLEKKLWGRYNMACGGETSRFEVAGEMLKLLKLSNDIKLNEVDSNFFSEEYFALRPRSERIINKKLQSLGVDLMRDWKVALREYLDTDYNNYL